MSLKDSLRNWLGYTRRERRSSTILLVIIFILAGIRYVVPGKTIDISELKQINDIMPSPGIISIQDTLKETIPAIKRSTRKSSEPLLDINSCDSAQLEALPGIGPVLSARIIKYRNLLGGFATVDQLKEVYGLPEETFNLILPRLYADTLKISKIRINKARYGELARLPYLGKNEVNAIIKYRELAGPVRNINDLVINKIIDPAKAGKLKPYFDFNN